MSGMLVPMGMLDQEHGVARKGRRGPLPKYAQMPRGGRVILDPAKLRWWRHERTMSRVDLAKAARMSVDSIRSYERGRRFPRESAFRRLYTALGIAASDLLFEDCGYVRKTEED